MYYNYYIILYICFLNKIIKILIDIDLQNSIKEMHICEFEIYTYNMNCKYLIFNI